MHGCVLIQGGARGGQEQQADLDHTPLQPPFTEPIYIPLERGGTEWRVGSGPQQPTCPLVTCQTLQLLFCNFLVCFSRSLSKGHYVTNKCQQPKTSEEKEN